MNDFQALPTEKTNPKKNCLPTCTNPQKYCDVSGNKDFSGEELMYTRT